MSRIDAVNRRYDASASLVRSGVKVVRVGDPAGARFDAAVHRLLPLVMEERGAYLDDLVGAARMLRWRCITQPQPLEFNPSLPQLAAAVTKYAARLHRAINDQGLLDELVAAADLVVAGDPVVGAALLRSLEEAGVDSSVVVAASTSAAAGLQSWLNDWGVLVLTGVELQRDEPKREQAYVVGPPRFYRPRMVTAPVTSAVSWLLPAWVRDRNMPQSAIGAYAEGAIRIAARLFTEGDMTEPESRLPDELEEANEYLPQPVWGSRQDSAREPTTEEVEAHRVLLSGNLAMWLDDGERIRSLDPEQPPEERVTYTDIPAVRVGTYLLLRQGETEHSALYHAAVARLARGGAIAQTQQAWKYRLAERIGRAGYREVVKQLQEAGVKAADRARAWTDPNLIRPQSDQDFARLLQWLDIPVQPTFSDATLLRKAHHQVSNQVRERLETAASRADLSELEAKGHLILDAEAEGFRGIIATRVLAISPFTEIVPRYDARVPFEDRGGQWLE